MKTIWKVIIIIIIVGLILSVIGFATGASRTLYLDRRGVHIGSGTINVIEETNLAPFTSINVDVGFSNIEFHNSDMFGINLSGEDIEWQWTLEDGVLSITHDKNTRWQIVNLSFIGDFRNHVRIYLPENSELDIVNIKTSSGDITLGRIQANQLEVNNSFGNVDLNDLTIGHMQVTLSSGRFTGVRLLAQNLIYTNRFGDGRFQAVRADSLSVDSGSGLVQFTNCEFGEAVITNNFGDITATGLNMQKSNIRANSGAIKITGDLSGETIMHAGFGDIDLTMIRAKEDFSYDISVRFGSINFDGERMRDQTALVSGSVQENHLKLSASSGDIKVSFGK